MAEYQHLVVVMSILLGMSVTQLLKGIAQLYRGRQRPYWLHSAWAVFLVVFSLLLWWTYWNYRTVTDWNFFRFVLYLSPTVVFYFLGAVTFPDPADSVTDLREYFYSRRRSFFGAFAAYGVAAGTTAVVVRGMDFFDSSQLFRLGMVLLSLVAMRSRNERLHAAIFGLFASLLIVFIVFFQLRLG
jgi:hypothetical protein